VPVIFFQNKTNKMKKKVSQKSSFDCETLFYTGKKVITSCESTSCAQRRSHRILQKYESARAPAGVQVKGDPADKLCVRGGSWTARAKRAAEVSFKHIVDE
jgi:hypothetical protein